MESASSSYLIGSAPPLDKPIWRPAGPERVRGDPALTGSGVAEYSPEHGDSDVIAAGFRIRLEISGGEEAIAVLREEGKMVL